MAHKRYAHAILSRSNIEFDEWVEEIRQQHEGAVSKDHIGRVAKNVLRKCDPKQYLLSHSTIVASVDAYAPKGSKTGRRMNRGVQIDVKYPDFRIKPECHEIINNNGDAWERSLLLSTYRTFISAPNYLEHIQLPELSKGFIVDAIARDLGKTCYVDILVATDRKHKQLVQDILAAQISAMSMGCISLFTVCTACGNVAVDDSQLCPCVAFDGKHSKFVDEEGIEHPVAELIGHVSVPNSNQFIEASWVRNPAFRGAVRRQILNPDTTAVAAKIIESALGYELRRDEINIDGIKKAASRKLSAQDDQEDPDVQDALAESEPSAAPETSEPADTDAPASFDKAEKPSEPKGDSIDELLNKAQEQIVQVLVDKLGEKLAPKPEDVGSVAPAVPSPLVNEGNDNFVSSSNFNKQLTKTFPNNLKLVKWASHLHKIVHKGGVRAIKAAHVTPRDLIILSWIEDRVGSQNYPADLYQIAMSIGPSKSFPSERSFLAACKIRLGRDLSEFDKQFLTWKGRIASVA
jgi:hypothetical protein